MIRRAALAIWDFVVGDDWRLALAAVCAIGLTAIVCALGLSAWWLAGAAGRDRRPTLDVASWLRQLSFVTRSLGAYLASPTEEGGLGLGTNLISFIFLGTILALVVCQGGGHSF